MKIVFLIGPSSAGKSTLCDALVSEHGWLTHGDDRVMQMIGEEQKAVLQERLLSHGLFGKLSQYMGEDAVIRLAETGLLEFEYGSISIKHQFRSPDFPNLKRVLSDAGFSNQELEKLTTLLSEVSTVFRNLPIPNPTDKMLDDIFNFPADSSVILDKVPHLHGDAH